MSGDRIEPGPRAEPADDDSARAAADFAAVYERMRARSKGAARSALAPGATGTLVIQIPEGRGPVEAAFTTGGLIGTPID